METTTARDEGVRERYAASAVLEALLKVTRQAKGTDEWVDVADVVTAALPKSRGTIETGVDKMIKHWVDLGVMSCDGERNVIRFTTQGYELTKNNIKDLRTRAQSKGLTSVGSKPDLIERLLTEAVAPNGGSCAVSVGKGLPACRTWKGKCARIDAKAAGMLTNGLGDEAEPPAESLEDEVEKREERKSHTRNEKAGLAKPLRDAQRHLRAALVAELSSLYLVSQHAGPDRKREAERVLSRYDGRVSFYIGFEKEARPSPLADWNRIGFHVLESVTKIERSMEALTVAHQVLQKPEVAELLRAPSEFLKLLKDRKVAQMLTQPGAAKLLKRRGPTSEKKRAAGKDRAKACDKWRKTVSVARKRLGLPGNVVPKTGTDLYKEAKELYKGM